MCFYHYGKNIEPEIAEEDIFCYKVVALNTSAFPPTLLSVIKGFEYELGVRYDLGKDLELIPEQNYDHHVIEEGFHSFDDIAIARRDCEQRDRARYFTPELDKVQVVECIIPKGAKFFHNRAEKEYVSTSIIVVVRHYS